MATSSGQFNANTNQAEADALQTKSAGQGNNKIGLTPGGNLETAQGASTTVGLNSNQASFNSPAPATHGALAKSYSLERSAQGNQDLEVVPYDQERTRLGWADEQSANNFGGTATPVLSLSIARDQIAMPTAPAARSTSEWAPNGADNIIPNVGARFMR